MILRPLSFLTALLLSNLALGQLTPNTLADLAAQEDRQSGSLLPLPAQGVPGRVQGDQGALTPPTINSP